MTDIQIRPIECGDYDAWSQLWTAYLAFYETTVPPRQFEHAFEQLLSKDPMTFRGQLAQSAGSAVGLVHYVFHPHMWRAEGVCYLQDLFCASGARGKGVGRALIQAVYRAADAFGAPRVYWLTQEFNYPGRMLYDRIGEKSPFIRYDRPRV